MVWESIWFTARDLMNVDFPDAFDPVIRVHLSSVIEFGTAFSISG